MQGVRSCGREMEKILSSAKTYPDNANKIGIYRIDIKRGLLLFTVMERDGSGVLSRKNACGNLWEEMCKKKGLPKNRFLFYIHCCIKQ